MMSFRLRLVVGFIIASMSSFSIDPGAAAALSVPVSPAVSQEAQSTPAAAPGSALPAHLTVEQAVRTGLDRSPQMAAAQAAVVAAERSYRSLASFPAVNLGVTHVTGSSSGPTLNGSTSDTFLDLGDTLDTSGQRHFNAANARALSLAARYQLEETSLTLTQQIRDAYWSLVAARAQAALARQSLQDAQKLFQLTTAQYQVGASPKVDTIRSGIDQANAVQSQVSADGAERTALTGFNVLLAQPASAPVDLADQLTETTVIPAATTRLPPLAVLTQRALAHRPLVLAAKEQARAASFALKQSRAARLPDLAVDYEQSVQQGSTYSVLLGIRAPLLDLGSVRNAIKAAEAARKQAEAQERQAEQQVTQQVAQAYTDLTQAQVLTASYQTDILSPSGTLLTVAEQGYQQGGTGILPVIDAQTTLRNARTGYVGSLLALYKAQDEIQAATGEPLTAIAATPIGSRTPRGAILDEKQETHSR
jgi:cobalt-zinc-cadmium efflux system outer membrane protein